MWNASKIVDCGELILREEVECTVTSKPIAEMLSYMGDVVLQLKIFFGFGVIEKDIRYQNWRMGGNYNVNRRASLLVEVEEERCFVGNQSVFAVRIFVTA